MNNRLKSPLIFKERVRERFLYNVILDLVWDLKAVVGNPQQTNKPTNQSTTPAQIQL